MKSLFCKHLGYITSTAYYFLKAFFKITHGLNPPIKQTGILNEHFELDLMLAGINTR